MDEWEYRPARDLGLTPSEQLRSLRRESGLISRATQMLWRACVYTYLKVYHRLRIRGAEHIPRQAPFVMIANHASHLDALVLASAIPWQLRHMAFPIAAGDVFFETPVASLFSVMMLNALPMWRKRCGPHAIQELRERLLTDPAIYLLFPEGQRTRDGKMNPFKPGLGMMVAASPALVVPCYLEGTFEACPPGTRIPRPRQIKLTVGPPLQFADVANRRAGWDEIADRLTDAVLKLSGSASSAMPHPNQPSPDDPVPG